MKETEILKELKTLKQKKSFWMIPPGSLKDAALVFTKPLTLIVNLFLETGIRPGSWKVAKVIHLYKSGCMAEIENLQTNCSSPRFVKEFGENSLQAADSSSTAS